MFLKEDGTARTLYLSQSSFPTKIYINVYQSHLSFIADIKMYSKQYICNQCDKVSTKMSNHLRHQTKCNGTVEYSILIACTQILRRISTIFVKALTRLRNWIQRKIRPRIKYMFQYRLVWGVNLEGVETVHVSSKYPEKLTAKLVDTFFEMADK